LGEVGHATTDQLGRWFGDRNIWPLVILHGEQTAGFAIVGRGTPQTGRAAVDYRMAEFFIARSCRRLGVGRDAVPIILDRFAGRWEIVELQSNAASVNFWRKVVARYTAGRYEERVNNGEVRQVFESGARRATPPR
jgi:predicted acetyltransferase